MRALLFIVSTLSHLYILTFVVRFLLQAVRADFYNPLAQFIVRVTNPLVVPLRRVLPGWRGLDMATLVVAFGLEIVAVALMVVIGFGALPEPLPLLLWASLRLVILMLQLYLILILIRVVLSWLNPAPSPLTGLLHHLTEPVLAPARRLLPPVGGLDLSPLLVMILLMAARLLIEPYLPGLLA